VLTESQHGYVYLLGSTLTAFVRTRAMVISWQRVQTDILSFIEFESMNLDSGLDTELSERHPWDANRRARVARLARVARVARDEKSTSK
jgi:hypothetical protein